MTVSALWIYHNSVCESSYILKVVRHVLYLFVGNLFIPHFDRWSSLHERLFFCVRSQLAEMGVTDAIPSQRVGIAAGDG